MSQTHFINSIQAKRNILTPLRPLTIRRRHIKTCNDNGATVTESARVIVQMAIKGVCGGGMSKKAINRD